MYQFSWCVTPCYQAVSGSWLIFSSDHVKLIENALLLRVSIKSFITRKKAPTVLTGNIGCIFGEDELRTSLFYDEPKSIKPMVSNLAPKWALITQDMRKW